MAKQPDAARRFLGAVQKEPVCIVSPAATPLGSVQDIVERSADDAGAVPLGTPPPGSPHILRRCGCKRSRERLNIVAFPSAEAARQAAVAGNVAAAALGLSNAIGEFARGGWMGSGSRSGPGDVSPDIRRCAIGDRPVHGDCRGLARRQPARR